VRVEGQFHRVVGAKRGPAPAHDVGIWLGAYKPRMLALTGRRADGWLPSLAYLQPGDLAAGNAIVDDAAQQAGRSPSEVRRLLNVNGTFAAVGRGPLDGPAEQWAEELAELALRDGIGTFILGSDDPDDPRRFGQEVAPAVRELVAADGASPGPAARPATAGPAVGRAPFAVVPTPDDGTRRSDRRVWDEAARPSGPTPPPERTHTAHEQASGQHLVDVHDMLRTELAQVHDLVDQVAAGTIDVGTARSHVNTMTMRQNKWTLGTYCESYCRIVTTHHTLEDRSLFPHLRHADPRLAPVIDRLEQEHAAIHDVLEGVDRALVAFVGSDDGMAGLRAAVDLLTDTLLSHLSYEERELVEPIARLGAL
jgi:hemerythrin-like domain-containing protein